ncbi:MAG: right-handed parallel beta-helix repeat-containing protein [Saprospiraceae bacterium]|nr:right-handed parallel beta-helix repeat-containing protein [Saprospiraceae bacterium]
MFLSNNEAANQGGGFYGKNTSLNMDRCAITDNSANQGGGLFFSNENYQIALIEKSVIANNLANQGGAMFLSDPPRAVPSYIDYSYFNFKIDFCTYYGNTASNGSVLYAPNIVDEKMVFTNSIVYGNSPNIHNHGEPHLPAVNSIIQGSVVVYPRIRSKSPDYINPSDLDGIDNVFFTDDDGLVPQVTGKAALAEIGAYMWNTSLCPSGSTLYVDINNPISGDGLSWATAFNDLNIALNFARRCVSVQEVRVAQGIYNPDPFNWYPSETAEEYRSATFILRPGLSVFGGYPTGGGTRDPSINFTTLTGSFTRNIVSIHEPNNNATDTTILDGFTIKGGFAEMTRDARTESYFSTGAGVKIKSNYVKINGNIIKENRALKASAIEVIGDHVEIANNTITDHTTSPSTYFLYEPKGSLITVEGDSCNINYNIISNNLLGDSSIILDIKGSNHNITGNDINANPSEPIYLQSFRSTCSFNSIKNNYGNGIKILGDSCEIYNNNIENNYLDGIYAEEKIIIYPASLEFAVYGEGYAGDIFHYNNFTKIHDNIIKANQKKGIYIFGDNDADVYSNTILNNFSDGVKGASSVRGNTFSGNATAIISDSATIHNNVIKENGIGISVDIGQVYNNYIIDNGTGIFISLGNVYNNVIAANDLEGGINVSNTNLTDYLNLDMHITNNTFYANKSTNPNRGGGLYVSYFKGDTVEISNNIFYQNALGIFTSIAGSDYRYNKLEVDYPPIFKNNLLQLSAPTYAGVTNNDLGIGSSNNIFSGFPDFIAVSDLDGPDNVYMTRDDGLVLGEFSVGIDAGFDQAIAPLASIDIAGIPRILGPQTDIGAYEKLNCVALDTLYVNKNHVHTTGGAGWLSALTDLDVALWLSQECTNVSVINVSADEYTPNSKPYEMQPTGKGIEIVTSDARDKTFNLRAGVDLYGGFIVRSGIGSRNSEKNKTILHGIIGDTSVLHTVMMSYHKDYWTDPQDTTLLDGFHIIGGEANEAPNQKLTVNNNDIFKSQGGGITVYGGTNKIVNCTVENSQANIGGAIFLNTDTTIVENSVFKQNHANIAAGIASVDGNYRLISNYFVDNNADTTACVEIENGLGIIINNAFDGNQSIFKSGALTLLQGTHAVVNNTFFNNSSTEVGALYVDGGNFSIYNNIFHRNKKNGLFDVVGSDYQHSAAPLTIAFNNNGMQLDKDANYNVTNHNELGGGTANLFDINPIFYDTLDMAGDDNKYGTYDDGLRLLVGSPMINVGANAAIPPYITTDIYGSPRIQKSIVELGAYEGPNVKCPEGIFDTLFVDYTVAISGNGSSWAQAFKTLDEAIFITHMCPFVKYICVAQGTYYPNAKPYNMQHYLQGIEVETIDPRDAAFHIRDGVILLGGYGTGGTERDLSAFNTILSGDINQNGSNQSYHTVLMASSPFWFIGEDTTVVDGVIVKDANANNKPYELEVNNSLIQASYGGGLYMTNGFHAVKNSTIEQNYSDEKGGGLYSYGTKSTSIQNNSIKQNTSGDGAGMFIRQGENLDLGYNGFSSNTAFDNGGGMYMDSTTNILHHNIVKSNIAKYGSGFYIKNQFKIEDSDFIFNTTTTNGQGGGIFTTKSQGIIDRCAFDGNITDLQGGGLCAYLCDSIFVWNSLFHNNDATNAVSLGGAVYNDKNDFFEQINCTAYANIADEGESIYTVSNNPILRNNIYYDSNPISILTGAMTLTNSIVKGGHPLCTSCPGTLGDINPVFADDLDVDGADNKYRTADDGFNVKISSPAINNGTSYGNLTHDITYSLREWGFRDIGAYETFKCPTDVQLYVDKQVSGGEGSDWNTALSEVSTALYVAQSCPNIEEIHVAKGDYYPSYKPFEMQDDQRGTELYTTSDLDKTFHVRAGLYVYGGYKNSGTDRNRDLYPSTLSGDISDSTFDARHVVLLGGDNGTWTGLKKIIFDGFHVTKGHSINFGGLTVNKHLIKYDVGAGIYGDFLEKITLNDNVIHDNLGHGLYLYGGKNDIIQNVISNNIGVDGGGAYFTQGFNTLMDNTISENSASQGGGLFLFQDSTILINNLIHQNSTTFLWGGGLFAQQTDVTLINNTVSSNISKYGGGAFIENSNFKLDSNSISNNSANQFGGGGIHIQNSFGRLYKNRFTSNNAVQNGGGLSIAGGDIEIESNLFTKNKSENTGGGINAGNAELLIVNNVFYKDTARSGSGIQTYYGFSEIQNNTFFQNEGSIDGGAFGTALGANDLTNNIFYQNTKSGANVIGADFYNDVFNESFNVFNNNAMQFAENDYTSANNNVLFVNAANVYNLDPKFEDTLNILGTDMVFGNGDDGLILQTISPLINVGNKNLIADSVKYDAKHEARVMNYQVDLGAYETFRDPCISNVIYVDTNAVAGANGQSWSKAFQTLSEALFVAHNCPNVDTILITEGTYFPETKPYEMDVTMKGQEITTGNDRDLTFHIRQGLTIIGGFPGGGDDSPSTAYKTNLVGRKEFSSFPSYHTIVMDTSAMWTNTNKESSIQYCIIKGGVGETGLDPDSIFVNSSWLNNSNGGGVYINGASGLLKYNTIKENDASSGGGLFIVNSSKTELADNEINNNFAEKEGAGVSSVQSFLELLNTNVLTNNSSRDDLRGLTGLESIIKLMGNNIIEGMNCKNGTVEVIGSNTIK